MKRKNFGRFLRSAICLGTAVGIAVSASLTAFATAGEDPGTVDDSEKIFPDPDSFSYDDVEVDFAKALQYSIYFYDANKCGSGITGGNLEWRGDCHTEDAEIPLIPMTEECRGTNLSQEFIDEYRDILDPDGDGTIDCEGGMHDAGDHVKFCLPGSYAASTLAWGYYEFPEAYEKTGNKEHIEEIIHWFCDFYLKGIYYNEDGSILAYCYQVGEGNIDHNYWIAPELQNTNLLDFQRPAYFATKDTPASDMCAGTSAALAIASLIFGKSEPEYAAECRKGAYALYDFAVDTHTETEGLKVTSLGYDGGFYTSSYDYDELAWAAVWLYECILHDDPNATEKAWEYIDDIIHVETEGVEELVDSSATEISGDTGSGSGGRTAYPYTGYMKRIMADTTNCWQNIWVHCWDTVWGGVFAKLAPITNTERDWYIFRWNLEFWSGETHLDPGQDDTLWDKEYIPDSQPEEPGETTYLKKTPAGFSMLNEYGSCRYNAAAGLCACVYAKYSPETERDPMRFAEWAETQMEYMMGKNPMNRPYIVGYSDTAASHPHHRAAHGSTTLNMDDPETQTHVLWGALVGGPDAGDWHRDITKDYIYNEVAVDYNAGFVGDCAGLYYYFGDDTMQSEENFPPKEADYKDEIVEYTIRTAIGQEDNMATQVLVEFTNHSMLPAHYLKDIKLRYYFNVSELLKDGQRIEDLMVLKEGKKEPDFKVRVDYDSMKSNTNGEKEVTYEVVQYNDEGDCYIEMTWSDYEFYGYVQYQFALVASLQDEKFNFMWDPTNDYSRSGLQTAKEQGIETLADALEEYDLVTAYVDGEYVWGNTPENVPSAETEYLLGDINCDGTVSITDVVCYNRFIKDDYTLKTKQQEKNGDVDGDLSITALDVARVMNYLGGKILYKDIAK